MFSEVESLTIATVLESASVKPAGITPDTKFYELGIDSITMLSILLKLEDKLSVSLVALGDQLEAPVTFRDLFSLVQLLQAAGTAEKNVQQ